MNLDQLMPSVFQLMPSVFSALAPAGPALLISMVLVWFFNRDRDPRPTRQQRKQPSSVTARSQTAPLTGDASTLTDEEPPHGFRSLGERALYERQARRGLEWDPDLSKAQRL